MKDLIFYFDGGGLRSAAGWYYRTPTGDVGPFHSQYSAEEALIELELQTEEKQ